MIESEHTKEKIKYVYVQQIKLSFVLKHHDLMTYWLNPLSTIQPLLKVLKSWVFTHKKCFNMSLSG